MKLKTLNKFVYIPLVDHSKVFIGKLGINRLISNLNRVVVE